LALSSKVPEGEWKREGEEIKRAITVSRRWENERRKDRESSRRIEVAPKSEWDRGRRGRKRETKRR
jgi:hypothetical protein